MVETVDAKKPPRGPLRADVAAAARVIHREVWGERYVAGEGPMHHAGGPYWRNRLLSQADHWERLAKAARACAQVLPDA